MFCPNCGKPDQKIETFCRQCGMFLPDFNKIKPREATPEEHLKANLTLNVMTAIASLTLAIVLYAVFLGRADTPVIIYITAGFLIAMFAWQAQVFWRNLKLRSHFNKHKGVANSQTEAETPMLDAKQTKEFLPEADFTNRVPASVVEKITQKLKIKN